MKMRDFPSSPFNKSRGELVLVSDSLLKNDLA